MHASENGRVVVGVSSTLAGYQALRFAVTHARRGDLPVVAVRAFRADYRTAPYGHQLAVEKAVAEVGRAFVDACGHVPTEVVVQIVTPEGRAAQALTAIADRVGDVLIIGGSSSRRPGLLRRTPVASECLRTAICPVVVVPPPALARRRSAARLARAAARDAQRFLRTAPTGATDPPQRS